MFYGVCVQPLLKFRVLCPAGIFSLIFVPLVVANGAAEFCFH